VNNTTQSFFHPSKRSESGQAFIEFSFVLMMMAVMLFGLIDFGRFIYERQVMVNLSREGSNLASRGTDITNAAAGVMASSSPLNLNVYGSGVIITAVTNGGSGQFFIRAQFPTGGVTAAASKVGNGPGAPATLSILSANVPPANETLYVTEVFSGFTSVTPIGNLLQLVMPPTNYDVAYFTGL
jgi:Flp pilus assembly protein TadG